MAKYILDRRRFLRRSGAALLTATAAGTVMFADPHGAWAITVDTLDAHEASSLLRMTRILYPHDELGDMYYATVVEALDTEAAKDPDIRELLATGVQQLDAATGVPFTALSEGTQTEVLTAMEEEAFFQKVRGAVVYHLYNNPLVWRHFGYEGSSAEHGGYITRGFQDIGWLDNPPADVSPPAYLG